MVALTRPGPRGQNSEEESINEWKLVSSGDRKLYMCGWSGGLRGEVSSRDKALGQSCNCIFDNVESFRK